MPSIVQPELCFASARQLASWIATRQVSCREVMAAFLAQIHQVNPTVNAIVGMLDDDRCLALADAADAQLTTTRDVGPLHGLPIAFKDLEAAAGFPHTNGSPIYRDHRPVEDSPWVASLRRTGVIGIGKTNVPEFGMGSHTYNRVYGTTRNPYDTTKSAGGSSGGAGAALAAGMLPIADGSDLGGSLRNPASFNNVVALRPSVGRLALAADLPYTEFSVKGPMARSVSDLAFLWDVMGGIAGSLERDFRGTRVAWCPDLGGLPMEPCVRAILDARRATFDEIGCNVEDADPQLADADEIFLTLRRWRSWLTHGPLLDEHRDEMKPEAVAEIEAGRLLSGTDVARAQARHAELRDRMRGFQGRHEFLICAVNQVAPFDASIDWPTLVDGVPMRHYIHWMQSTYWISATWCPAISVPAGFTAEGLPVGIQIVGRYNEDRAVLQLAHAFEQATRVGQRRPRIAA
jgi:amidase